jgi:hypothetical protein
VLCPFFFQILNKHLSISYYIISLPDKENDPENILYTGKEDAHDGAQVSLQSRVAGYTVITKFNHRRRCFSFSVIGQSMIVISSSLFFDFSHDI